MSHNSSFALRCIEHPNEKNYPTTGDIQHINKSGYYSATWNCPKKVDTIQDYTDTS